MVNGLGNYAFVLTAVDSRSSSPDQLALQLTAPNGAPAVASLTFSQRALTTGSILMALRT